MARPTPEVTLRLDLVYSIDTRNACTTRESYAQKEPSVDAAI
jgi:hypothetical protein